MNRFVTSLSQTLLIADGDAEWCELYRQIFTKRGYEVETCSDGLDCLMKLQQVTPAVLVLDLDLPWGGGDGILAWLRDRYPWHAVPVILTTKAGNPRTFAPFIVPPVVEFLLKPIALIDLVEKRHSVVAATTSRVPSQRHRDCPEIFIG